ncbi:MAG: ABC transporter permease, partial [Melioribacteraceae bacterium]|nr:ABC transporter permease [Melioribacteraceae bacterium]
MLSLYNIRTIIKYELKTLFRSWFLRIFSGIILIILFLYDLLIFTETFQPFMPRDMYGMTASIPYINILFFNIGAAVIAVFLASDFLKRDKKLDTSEAIYIRSMTNADYVIGKALALFIVFSILNLIVILIALGFNLFTLTNISLSLYLYYFIVISTPTIIFITGLSFLVMTLIKNQAVTFILLLGYIAVTLFYIGNKFYNLFDYTGVYIPFLYSDFVGFGNLFSIILIRTLYLSLGISFIFFTIILFKRLPQSPSMQKTSTILTFIFLGSTLFAGFNYVNNFVNAADTRISMKGLNNVYAALPLLNFVENKIKLLHNGSSISVVSEIDAINNNSQSVNETIFKLNPGLEISKITANGEEIDFLREEHLILLSFKTPLISNEKINFKMEYSGEIFDFASYLDQSEDVISKPKRIWMFASANQFSFITPSYLLLTQENMWYPTSGISYSFENQLNQPFDFTKFQLTVNNENNLTVISQGNKSKSDDGSVTFVCDNPLPQIS